MTAVAAIVANDGATTPVAFTFSPTGQDAKGIWWYEQTSPAPANKLGARKLSIRLTRNIISGSSARGSAGDTAKAVISLYSPFLSQTGNSAAGYVSVPRVEYALDARCEYTLPERASDQERKDQRVLIANAISGSSQIMNLIDKLENIW